MPGSFRIHHNSSKSSKALQIASSSALVRDEYDFNGGSRSTWVRASAAGSGGHRATGSGRRQSRGATARLLPCLREIRGISNMGRPRRHLVGRDTTEGGGSAPTSRVPPGPRPGGKEGLRGGAALPSVWNYGGGAAPSPRSTRSATWRGGTVTEGRRQRPHLTSTTRSATRGE